MIPAPRPSNDHERIRALRAHVDPRQVKDDGLQAVAELAAKVIGVPVALVSLLDAEEQLFAGCVGLDGVDRTPRDVAFCGYTILGDGVLEVPDARADARFCDNPLVTGEPHIRFYAGAPLESADGYRLGTLCLIDSVTRRLDDRQRAQLIDMAAAASRVLHKMAQLQDANAQLRAALADARSAERATTTFFAGISHELRTPLNAVIGFAEVLEQQCFGAMPDPRYADYARDIRQSGEHLLSLINDILDVSRLEAGQHRLYPEEIRLADQIDWALRMLEPLCSRYAATIEPPADAGDVVLLFDPRALRQVLLNLLGNAVKYAGAAGPIRLELARTLGQVRLTVADRGPGMAPETVAALFQPFVRAEGVSRHTEGTGLGLALCKRLLDLAGADIRIDSAPGQGTRVEVTLPALNDDAPAASPAPRRWAAAE